MQHAEDCTPYMFKLPAATGIITGTALVFSTPFINPESWLLWLLPMLASMAFFLLAGQLLRSLTAVIRGVQPLRRGSAPDTKLHACRWQHVFIIPNYRESAALLDAMLAQLATHEMAKQYTLLLAMEARENGAYEKAKRLQNSFGGAFKSILIHLHHLQPGGMPGKAANVDAAVRTFYKVHAVGDRRAYMLTICDADARVPPGYVQHLERCSMQHGNAAWRTIYSAPVVFDYQHGGASMPLLVLAMDMVLSMISLQYLNSWGAVGCCLSNYSLSLTLAHEIE